MSASDPPGASLLGEVEALTAAIMADAPLAEIKPIADRLQVAMDRWNEIPVAAVAELRSAIDLMYGGRTCATVSALLAARSELSRPPS